MGFAGKSRRIGVTVVVVALLGASGALLGAFSGSALGGESGSPVQAWGDNSDGQIGHGPRGEPVRSPVTVEGISCAVSSAVGFEDGYAVLADGHVSAWGADNADGGLGDGDPGFQEYSYTPVEVPGISDAVQIAAETSDTYVLLSDGTIDAWGTDKDGRFTPFGGERVIVVAGS